LGDIGNTAAASPDDSDDDDDDDDDDEEKSRNAIGLLFAVLCGKSDDEALTP